MYVPKRDSMHVRGTVHVLPYQIQSPDAHANAIDVVRELKQGGNQP